MKLFPAPAAFNPTKLARDDRHTPLAWNPQLLGRCDRTLGPPEEIDGIEAVVVFVAGKVVFVVFREVIFIRGKTHNVVGNKVERPVRLVWNQKDFRFALSKIPSTYPKNHIRPHITGLCGGADADNRLAVSIARILDFPNVLVACRGASTENTINELRTGYAKKKYLIRCNVRRPFVSFMAFLKL